MAVTRRTRNAVVQKWAREFESLLLRQKKHPEGCFFVTEKVFSRHTLSENSVQAFMALYHGAI